MDILVDDLWNNQSAAVPGYFVFSTAPINIEDNERKLALSDSGASVQSVEGGVDWSPPTIDDLVETLYQNTKSASGGVDLVVQIHGYNTGATEAERQGEKVVVQDKIHSDWQTIGTYLNQDNAISRDYNRFVYLGYRWPSEGVPANFGAAVRALPLLLGWLGGMGAIVAGLTFVMIATSASPLAELLLAFAGGLAILLAAIVVSLLILRMIVYFRDSYRANHFAVPDLVEFIRQLDQRLLKRQQVDRLFTEVQQQLEASLALDPALLATAVRKTWEALETQPLLLSHRDQEQFRLLLPSLRRGQLVGLEDAVFLRLYDALVAAPKPVLIPSTDWDGNRIKLSFIGHSMGAFVTTQTIRILSDAFAPSAIGGIDSLDKLPSGEIGRVFSLGRLILVSPDIPVKTIVSGRANFLRSSLRRFEEAYLFSNEGDLALRLASTAANYFSFPASSRTQGYRLGNVTVNLQERNVYGIVNLSRLKQLAQQPGQPIDRLLKYIGISVMNRRERSLDAAERSDVESIATDRPDPESIADLFTYLDCTEYRDQTDYKRWKGITRNVLIGNGQRSPLNLLNYLRLTRSYINFSQNPASGVDVHGGYFYGYFSKLMIYRLAFLGFKGLMDSLVAELLHTTVDWPNLKQAQAALAQADESQKRQIALEYFDWLCQTKRIQVALSSERYYAYVQNQPIAAIRAAILKSQAAEQRQLQLPSEALSRSQL